MKLIELHILQSFPVSCLNRDDVGAPKSATFGGVNRARLSSQCLKRAIREHCQDEFPDEPFAGIRSRFLHASFVEALRSAEVEEPEKAADELVKVFSKTDPKNREQVTTAVYLSPGELSSIAAAMKAGKSAKDAAKKAQRLDAADIALFGRMVANDPTLNVEGAAMFSHALSTHKADNEIDFFSAVDDRKTDADDAGAGMIGTLEYTSAVYYRYAGLNLDLLADEHHLGGLELDQRKAVVNAFIRATLMAVPGARRNSMNANTLPSYALGIYKDRGQPLQLINAFEEPVPGINGIVKQSEKKLEEHHKELKKVWDIATIKEVELPSNGLKDFCEELVSHVI